MQLYPHFCLPATPYHAAEKCCVASPISGPRDQYCDSGRRKLYRYPTSMGREKSLSRKPGDLLFWQKLDLCSPVWRSQKKMDYGAILTVSRKMYSERLSCNIVDDKINLCAFRHRLYLVFSIASFSLKLHQLQNPGRG